MMQFLSEELPIFQHDQLLQNSSVTLISSFIQYPLELLMIRRQVSQQLQILGLADKVTNYFSAFKQVSRDGKLAFYKGFLPSTVARVSQCFFWPLQKNQMISSQVLTEILFQSVTYPLVLISNLISIKPGQYEGQFKSFMSAFQEIQKQQTKYKYYRGFSLYLLSAIPSSIFQNYINFIPEQQEIPLYVYSLGLLYYPLDTLRLRLLIQQNSDMSYNNIKNFITQTLKNESPRALFAGSIPYYSMFGLCFYFRQKQTKDRQ